jgi:hypothetical protein
MADDLVELRGKTPKSVVAYLDAFALAKRMDRMEVVNRILLTWAREQEHLQSVLASVTRGNPSLPDSGWGRME